MINLSYKIFWNGRFSARSLYNNEKRKECDEMFAVERQKYIIAKLNEDGIVFVSRLASELNVTEETIRRDLEKLEKQEYLRRTHGGAVSLDESTYELSLEKRKSTNVEAKQRLAVKAATFVASGDTIFLDASTTTFYMARELKKLKNVTIITNSMRIVSELVNCDGIKVIAVGGVVSGNQSFIGTLAENNIAENYFASKMFFSSKGITEDAGILESNEAECGIKQKMLANANTKYYLCDKSKIGAVGFVKLATFDKINCIITDSGLNEQFTEKFRDAGVEIIEV